MTVDASAPDVVAAAARGEQPDRSRAGDEHPVAELAGVPVLRCRDLVQGLGQVGRDRRDVTLARSRRQHHGIRQPAPGVGLDDVVCGIEGGPGFSSRTARSGAPGRTTVSQRMGPKSMSACTSNPSLPT